MKNEKQNGKIAFITGANRGLGLETARELGKQGRRFDHPDAEKSMRC